MREKIKKLINEYRLEGGLRYDYQRQSLFMNEKEREKMRKESKIFLMVAYDLERILEEEQYESKNN